VRVPGAVTSPVDLPSAKPRLPSRLGIDPLVIALVIFALAIDLARAGEKSVWLDEAISDSHARESFGTFWQTVSHTDPNMSLYYLLLRPWVAVFGDGEAALRSLSAVFAALAAGALAILGRRLFDRWTGLVAGLFLAMDGYFVEYAQTARSYTLVVLLVIVSSYFFTGELQRPSGRGAVGYVVSSALAVYAHDFAGYVLLTQLLTLLAVERRGALTKRWALIFGSLLLLCIPEIVVSARAGTGTIAWIVRPRLWDLADLPVLLLYSEAIAVTLVCLAGYAIASRLRRRRPPGGGWQIWFVTAWFLVPVLLAFAVSYSVPMFVPYYLLVSLPGLLLAGAAGLVGLPSRIAASALLVLLVAGMGKEIHRWYATPTIENYRSAIRAVHSRAEPGDVLMAAPTSTEPALAYYARRNWRHPPLVDPGPGPLPSLPTRAPRIWLVLRGSTPAETAPLYAALARHYRRTTTHVDVSGINVTLYLATRATAPNGSSDQA
jgi:mannosyltransferase